MAATSDQVSLHAKASHLQHLFLPLDEDKNEFRLIKLNPGIQPDPIHCTLLCVGANHAPNYEALSYVWGDPNQHASITLNDYNFNVTINLKAALCRLRSKTESTLLWIDAICINQENLEERRSQVCRMRNIYRNAQRVIAWIGEEAEDTFLAMKMLKEAESQDFSAEYFRRYLSGNRYTPHLIALKRLYLRDYWTRVWVVQEVSSAQSAIIRCGQFSIAWSSIISFGEAFLSADEFNNPSWEEGPSLLDTEEDASTLNLFSYRIFFAAFGPKQLPLPGHTRHNPEQPLLQTLLKNRNKMSSDPRDKVFGLLGIVSPDSTGHNRLQVDYNRSVKDVYSGVVQAVVETTQCLDIICASRPNVPVGSWNVRPEQLDLPSWVPDWSVCPSVHKFNNMGTPFRAAGSSLAQANFSSRGETLTAKGFCLGSISLCGDVCNLRNPSETVDVWFDLILCVIGWRNSLFILTKDDGSMKDAFFRILYANFIDFYERSPDPEIFGMFVELKMICMELEVFGTLFAFHYISGRIPSKMNNYLELMYRATGGRRFISFSLDVQGSMEFASSRLNMASSDLMIGLAPNTTQTEDKVCILLGCNIPVIIRPEGDHYVFIGEAYVHGVMHGELIEILNNANSELQSFSLY